MRIEELTLSFTASTDSSAMVSNAILGVDIPASFGVTSLTFLKCSTSGGTYTPVYDETGAAIGITGINSVSAGHYSLGNVYPLSLLRNAAEPLMFVKFRSPSSITKDIVVTRGGI